MWRSVRPWVAATRLSVTKLNHLVVAALIAQAGAYTRPRQSLS
jgi:hypothetical protein